MTGIERLAIAVAVGLIQAVAVWTISTIYNLPKVWPGTILAFAISVPTVLLALLLLVRLRSGGRR